MIVWVVSSEDFTSVWSAIEKAKTFVINQAIKYDWKFSDIRHYDTGKILYECTAMGETVPVTITPYKIDEES